MKDECIHCEEAKLNVGDRSVYGAIVIYKKGNKKNRWYATLSPKTIDDVEKDFSVQLMPLSHIKHISDLSSDEDLAKNYGLAFSKLNKAITELMKEERRCLENEEEIIRIGVYGKSKHPEEHFHIKLFPWKHSYVVDSTYEKSQVHVDKTGEKYIRLPPVRKRKLEEDRHQNLAIRLIEICNNS